MELRFFSRDAMRNGWRKRRAAGVDHPGTIAEGRLPANFKTGNVLPDSRLEALNARATALFAAPDDIARAVRYAVIQPYDVNVSEILVGPRKAFPNHV